MTIADQDFGSNRQRGGGRRGAHAKTSPRWPDGGAGPYATQRTLAPEPPLAGGDPRFGRQDPRWPDAGPPAYRDPEPPAYQADHYQGEYYQSEYQQWSGQPEYTGRTGQPAYQGQYPGWTRQPAPQADYPQWAGQPAYQEQYPDPGWTRQPAPQAEYPGWTEQPAPLGRLSRLDRAAPGRVPRPGRTVRSVRPPSRPSQLARIPDCALARCRPGDRPSAVRGAGRAAAAGTGATPLHPPA